jgi:hypothetical protein
MTMCHTYAGMTASNVPTCYILKSGSRTVSTVEP